MVQLNICTNARDDLAKVKASDEQTARKLVAILQQLQADPGLINTLTTDHNALDAFEVKRWVKQHEHGKNIWFIKPWKHGNGQPPHLPYRIIYAYSPPRSGRRPEFNILGIVPREFNYEANHPTTLRILRDYAGL